MSADQARILAEVSDLLRAITTSLLPDEEITLETRLLEDLDLQSIGLANLSGRILSRYGAAANLVPFLAGRGADPLGSLRVGELVDYLAGVLAQDEPPAVGNGTSPAGRAGAGPAGGRSLRDSRRPVNDNEGVLRELAPGTTRRLLRLPGGQVEVFTAGDGPPLVLMHPINVGAGVFARQFASLAGRYRVICAHNPGVGATTWDADLTLTGLARLQRTVLAQLRAEPPFRLVGSSFGGLVAQEFALLHPEECAALVLAGCSYRAMAGQGFRLLPEVVRDEFDRMRAGGGPADAQGGLAELEELLLRCESMESRTGALYVTALMKTRPGLFARLPEITAPSLILRGRHDTMVPAKDAHLLHGAIPSADYAELPQAGHFPFLTHPAEVDALLAPFLAAPAAAAAIPRRPPAGTPASPARLDRCIIISSGRCGSTLLSALIAEEPETLSVFESLELVRDHLAVMPRAELTGAEYWALLSEAGPIGSLLDRTGIQLDGMLYPATGRWAGDWAALPNILYITLPALTADPDQLFDLLARQVPGFPAQTVGQHHRMLLDLLATMLGRRRWVERTGASSALAKPLLTAFPDAKVVYLTRDIEPTARSMSRHVAFQLTAVRHQFRVRHGTDPYSRWARPELLGDPDGLPEDMRRLLPDRLTAAALQDLGRDTGVFTAMCAHMAGSAEQALADQPPRHLHRMRYEDLAASPAGELSRLGEFLGFADPSGWAARTAHRVRRPAQISQSA
jgi:putative sulfotransferase